MALWLENTMKYANDTFASTHEGFIMFTPAFIDAAYHFGNDRMCGSMVGYNLTPDTIRFEVDADIPNGATLLMGLAQNAHRDISEIHLLLIEPGTSDNLWSSKYLFTINGIYGLHFDKEEVARYVRKYLVTSLESTVREWRNLTSFGANNGYFTPIFYMKANDQGKAPVVRSVSMKGVANTRDAGRPTDYMFYARKEDKPYMEILSARVEAEASNNVTQTKQILAYESEGIANRNDSYTTYNITEAKGKRAQRFNIRTDNVFTGGAGGESYFYKGFEATYAIEGDGLIGNHSELITTTENLGIPAKYIRLTLKHDKFEDNRIIPYVSFKPVPQKREKYQIGVGNGSVTAYTIPDTGVNPETFHIFTEDSEFFMFDFNLEVNQVIVNAADGVPIYASYEYGHELEEWIPLKKGQTIKYRDNALYSTDYEYMVPENEEGKEISTVKFVLERDEGRVEHQYIGTGAGHMQLYMVEHKVKPETVKVNDAWVKAIRDAKCIEVNGRDGAELYVDYDWIADCPKMYGYYIAWNE